MKITEEEIGIAANEYASKMPYGYYGSCEMAFIEGAKWALEQQKPKTIREMRIALKMTMREVAEACGTNTYYIPQIENGTKGKRAQTGTGTTYKRVYEYLQNKLNEQK